MHIGIAEDDGDQLGLLELWLSDGKHTSKGFATAAGFIEGLKKERFDLLLVDWMLPDGTGADILAWARENLGWDLPVIVVTAREDEATVCAALNAGADDYVVKPFGMAELLARIGAALRRRAKDQPPQPVFATGGLEVDLGRRIVRVENVEVRLSPKQYRLLQVLVVNAGKVVTHRQLLGEVWGAAHVQDIQYLRVFVRKLRDRIEPDPTLPRYLVTELGVGYRLRTPDQLTEAG